MPTNSSTGYDIYVGAWTDWSKGRLFGATLTLSRYDGILLIAFLAFFVALVSTRFWRLACLVLHYTYSKDGPGNRVHHQRQLFLRNAPNPESAVWKLASLGLSWRRNTNESWKQLLAPFGLATTCVIGFALASGFLPNIATVRGTEVLLSGVNCVYFGSDYNMTTFSETVSRRAVGHMIAAENYVRECYEPTTRGVSCSTYVRRSLPPAVVDTNATCPFDDRICKNKAGNLFLDSGYLDSHDHFGLNTPSNRRLQFRRQLHCAPLATDGYRIKNQTHTAYYYGPMENLDYNTTKNYTAAFSNDIYPDIDELTHNSVDSVHDFSIRTHYSRYWNGSHLPDGSSFVPILELKPEIGRLMVFFLTSGRILFSHPTNDPWYGPTTNTTEIHKLKFSDWGNTTMFRQDNPGSPLGCKEMDQYCFIGATGQQTCSSFGLYAMGDMWHLAEEKEREWLGWMLETWYLRQPTSRVVTMLGSRSLTAKNKLNEPLIGLLPDTQWQLDVQHWHATSMAYMQAAHLQPLLGYNAHEVESLEHRYPNTTIEKELCANQKILSAGHISISILGLSSILIGGGAIIVLSLASTPLLSWYAQRTGNYHYAKIEWANNETFRLQSMSPEPSDMELYTDEVLSPDDDDKT